ncbi:hypothetical protein [Silvimonas iriomotensis]|uniref:hypothetical protein n=1 Tax=Silvimonas iriomotensis TaxID=449662 RepID=UPI00166DF89E|nr:hypothetical protein [Silvimonas iriomotensis]
MKRPVSITIIGWFLIVTAAFSLISVVFTFNNPMVRALMEKSPLPIPIQFLLTFVGLLVTVISGVALLKRRHWARLLYSGWSVLGFAVSLATSPMKPALIPGLVIFLIIVFFLFRPTANQYFAAQTDTANAPDF